MGWSYTHKPYGQTIREFFEKEFNAKDRILDCAVVNRNTAYIAFKTTDGQVFGLVCLLRYVPRDYFNFGYKDIEEVCGPFQANCPERILKLLTPTTNPTANEWRQKCWDNLNKIKAAKDLMKVGNTLKLDHEVNLVGGGSIDKVVVLKPRSFVFLTERGLVRLRKRHLLNCTLIPA